MVARGSARLVGQGPAGVCGRLRVQTGVDDGSVSGSCYPALCKTKLPRSTDTKPLMNGGEGMKEPGFGTIKKLNWSSTVWPGSPLSRTSMITPLNPSGVGVSDFSIAPPITAAFPITLTHVTDPRLFGTPATFSVRKENLPLAASPGRPPLAVT
jgi:hypothetical protein